jgi:hypothetical protein
MNGPLEARAALRAGHKGIATLRVGGGPSTIALDPAFLATASYPITIQRSIFYLGQGITGSPRAESSELTDTPLQADAATASVASAETSGEQRAASNDSELFVAVVGGANALVTTGPWAWGNDQYGQVGNGTTESGPVRPTRSPALAWWRAYLEEVVTASL